MTANITQAPAALALNGVAGDPFGIRMNVTVADGLGDPVAWADVTDPVFAVISNYGVPLTECVPTITSPEAGQWSIAFTDEQTEILGSNGGVVWSLSATILGIGPLAFVAGSIRFQASTVPGTGTSTTADLSVTVGTAAVNLQVTLGGSGGVVESVIAGTSVHVDDTDPGNPIVSIPGGTFDASGAASAALATAEAYARLNPTAVKTSSYSAAVQDLGKFDTTAGVISQPLPNAPADKSLYAAKIVASSATPHTLTLACQGSDVINITGGSTSYVLKLLNQSVLLQYQATGAIWNILSDDLPLGQLDTRFDPAGSATTAQSNAEAASVPIGANGGPVFLTSSYGAKGDHAIHADGAATASSSTFTALSSTPFLSTDVGKVVHVPGGGTVIAGVSGTLTTALTSGTAVTALAVSALSGATVVPNVSAVIVTSGAHVQVFKTNGVAASGTSVPVLPPTTLDTNVPNFSFPIGSTVTFAQDLITTVAGYTSPSSVTLTAAVGSTLAAQPFGFGTDDSAAINSAMAAASAAGGGTVQHRGSSMLAGNGGGLAGALLSYNNVRLIGVGEGGTVFYPVGSSSCIGDTSNSTGSPRYGFGMQFCTIDGSHQYANAFNVNICGIRLPYNAACTFSDLTIRYTLATGLGNDFPCLGTDTRNIKAINCGRFAYARGASPGTPTSGCSGIGIGTGNQAIGAASYSDCYTYNNGFFGMFFESETGSNQFGIRVNDCYSEANYHGFGDCGMTGAVFTGCQSYNNFHDGFIISNGTVINGLCGDHLSFVGCHAYSNGTNGFEYVQSAGLPAGAGHLSFKDCKSWGNSVAGHGIRVSVLSGSTLDEVVIDGCELENNWGCGVIIIGPGTLNNLVVTNNRIRDNGLGGSTTAGIQLNSNAVINRVTITGNKAWDDQGSPTQTYGLTISSGAVIGGINVSTNDFSGNKTGSVNNAGTLSGSITFRDNIGYNPVGSAVPGTAFAIGLTTAASTNNTGVDGTLYVTAAGTVTGVSVNGVAVSGTMAVGDTYRIKANGTLTLTYSGAPTLVFVGD